LFLRSSRLVHSSSAQISKLVSTYCSSDCGHP
jgi:hypothetical protein